MWFVNITFVEFLALFGAISAFVIALYLLDRSRRRVTVATLRFWRSTELPTDVRHPRRIQQPLSLLLQILAILLLLLAFGQLRLGGPDRSSRDHVLVLDTSSWMHARANLPAGSRPLTLMDQARASAIAYVRNLPPGDRVMLVRADALPMPVTAFEDKRKTLEEAIRQTEAGFAALHVNQALEYAVHSEKLYARRGGEIVYVGAGRITEDDQTTGLPVIPNLRVILLRGEWDNIGLRKISLRRADSDPALWQVLVSVKNYTNTRVGVPIVLRFGGAPVGSRRVNLAPREEQDVKFEYRTRAAGWIEARLLSQDGFPGDNRVLVELPAFEPLKVVVYSAEPDLLRPVLASNPVVDAQFKKPAEYQPRPDAAIAVLDRFRPPQPPEGNTIWIEPPSDASPLPVHATHSKTKLVRWTDHSLGTGLRTRDLMLESTLVFRAGPMDIAVAEVEQGPCILARDGKAKTAVLGFHPAKSAIRFELATPLLFANLLRWIAPEAFHRPEVNGGAPGMVTLPVDAGAAPESVQVTADGRRLPFTLEDGAVRFFAGEPGTTRISTGTRELVYSAALPEVAAASMEVPPGAAQGIPRPSLGAAAPRELWQWLALLGGLVLLAEWLMYGRGRSTRVAVPSEREPVAARVRRAS